MKPIQPLLIALIIVGCTAVPDMPISSPTEPFPATQTPRPGNTPTDTLVPTATSIPLYRLSGTVFFDCNGSGEQDLAYCLDNEEPLEEPGIAGIQICMDGQSALAICVPTGGDGDYSFDTVPLGGHSLFVEGPSGDPASEYRYINVFNGSIDINTYDVEGVQVPAQRLAATEIRSLRDPIPINIVEDMALDIAIMQGWLSIEPDYPIYSYFDLDDRSGNVRNYQGDTGIALFPKYRPGTFDQHTGIDFECNTGDPVFAPGPGSVILSGPANDLGALAVEILHHSGFTSHSGHLSLTLVDSGEAVQRGQLIGLCGQTGTEWSHIHFQLGNRHGQPLDPFQDVVDPATDSDNHWIVYNKP